VEELYGTRYQSGSFSLLIVGSGFHCLRRFSFFYRVEVVEMRWKEKQLSGSNKANSLLAPAFEPPSNGPRSESELVCSY